MRYIPTNCLKENMILGKNIYSEDGTVLLAANVVLTYEYINSLQKLGINGVYIEDSISQNIEIKNVISEELKIEAIKSIKETYNNTSNITKNINTIKNIAVKMMDEILNNKSVMINMVDIKSFDNYMYMHSVNVGILAAVMGIALNLESKKIEKLTISALLHDIGKVFISKDIVNKAENLSDEEEKSIKKHPNLGYKYIRGYYNIAVTSYVGILQHHERYDGKGYPDNKKGEEISLFGRIISICDAYDNAISNRYGKEVCTPTDAIEYIMAYNGQKFDPKIVKIFLRKVAPYPLGSILKLSNGEEVIVIENNEECSMRPKVRGVQNNVIYDLTYDWNLKNITILGVVNR